MSKISIIFGTRPEIIKLSPIIKVVKRSNIDMIFSGQHYDYDLGLKFIEDLGLPKPDFKMNLSRGNPAKQIGEMIQRLASILSATKPDTIVVQGDTNTVLAGAIAGIKCKIPISHVEAGLRSFDWRMPEEHNRIVTDSISELLFAPTFTSKQNLISENTRGKIFVVGNTVIDAVEQNLVLAEKKSRVNVNGDFILMTLHRTENVDDKKTLGDILKGVLDSGEKFVFPIHPRTLKRVHEFGFYKKLKNAENIILLNAVSYFDTLWLMKHCKFIVSDSGGIQEEATSQKIRKKVLIVRKTTDRPEAVDAGASELVGTSVSSIRISITRNSDNPRYPKSSNIYGNGNSSHKIVKILNKYF